MELVKKERVKKEKKKEKKMIEQYVNSPLNNKMLDYKVYKMTWMEKSLYVLIAFMVGGAAGLIFYGGLFKEDGYATTKTMISNIIVFCMVGILTVKIFLPIQMENLRRKRQNKLKQQFQDMLESLSTSFIAGSNVMDSFMNAYRDTKLQYGAEALIVKELEEILEGINNNISIEEMMSSFGNRSGVEDIRNFANVFETCYRKGGNLKDVIRRTHSIISEKMAITDEIETKLTSNKTQQKVMNLMPILLIAMLRFTNETFAENFAKPTGIISITIAIGMFLFAYFWGRKIVDIKG